MKRFCLDFSIVLMAIAFLVCFMAIPEAHGSLPMVLAAMVGLACAMRLAYQQSVRLEKRALRAKQVARRRAALAKRRAALVQAGVLQVAAPSTPTKPGLFVA